ncbi:MAG: 30S ribosomal protein S4 [Candidatus Diapherotrites archaeon]|nr:30S ribosomal protein S4 [Candidatus Diapherotrites archaeon]
MHVGDIRKPRKQYTNPAKRWDKDRIEREKKIMETYGLKNKREIRRIETLLRGKRENAKKLLALPLAEREKRSKALLDSLGRLGVLPTHAALGDVLGLTITEFLERRLQTIVWRKGFANTAGQARQFIAHGHIRIGTHKTTSPSYLVPHGMEGTLAWTKKPVLVEASKPAATKETKEDKTLALQKEFEAAKPVETENPVDSEEK